MSWIGKLYFGGRLREWMHADSKEGAALQGKGSDSSTSGALASLLIFLLLFSPALRAEESKAKTSSPPPKKEEKKNRKPLSGAELYAIHCNRCHPERYAPERTADQWKTILLHMRTRANIPAQQAREILKFLQEDSGK
jgi:mono/diheme cytochrome c family protein